MTELRAVIKAWRLPLAFCTLKSLTSTEAILSARSERFEHALNDRYRIERELGQGGMAVVYLATDLRQSRAVALKVLRPELAGLIGPDRFLREIEIAGKLSHPHIVPLFDAGEADGLPYYVMPFIEGESLRDRLKREEQLGIEEALQITREVADALTYAHALGVIHRDIKPENIMLSRGHALLADFGIARAVSGGEKLTGTGMAIGTVAYMSPEQALGSDDVDARGDQYSLACVLYEMLVGAPPFVAPSPQAVLAKQLADPVPPIRTVRNTVPAPMEAAIVSALAKTKADRFPSVSAFVEAIEGKRPSPSQPSPASVAAVAAPSRPARQRRNRLVLAVAVLGALGITGAACLWLTQGSVLEPKRVVVAPFENQTGDATLDPLGVMTADWITRGLTETGLVDVADPRLAMLNPEKMLAQSPWNSARTAQLLAEQVNAGIVVSGTVFRQRDSLVFQASISDARTGEVLRSVAPVTGPVAAPLVGIEALKQRVIGSLATVIDPALTDGMKAMSSPPTFAAYREYMEGRAAQLRSDWPNALQHFYRASRADSSYTLPLVDASEVLYWMNDCAGVDSIGRVLEPRRERMARYDRVWLDRQLASCRQDNVGAYQAALQLRRLAPRSDWTALELAHEALKLNRTHEVVSLLGKLNPERGELRGQWAYYVFLTLAEHLQGDYRRELRDAERGRRQYPDDLGMLAGQVRALVSNGRVGEVNSRLDDGLGMTSPPDTPFQTAGDVMRLAASELTGHGYPDAARSVWDRTIAWYRDRARSALASDDTRGALADVLYGGQYWEEARMMYDTLAAERPDDPNYLCSRGLVAARQGRRADAERIAAEVAARKLPHADPFQTLCRASFEAVLGRRVQAIALLREANEQGAGFNNFYRHVDPDFASLRGDPAYEVIMRPKN